MDFSQTHTCSPICCINDTCHMFAVYSTCEHNICIKEER
jgi:hypothetical protein